MARSIAAAALGVLALGAGVIEAQEPPALEAPIEASAGDPPPPPRPLERPTSRPLLVIPGVTAPLAPRASKPAATEVPPAPPALDGPEEPADPAGSIPLRLESIPPPAAGERRSTTRSLEPSAPGRRSSTGSGRILGGTPLEDADVLSRETSRDPAVDAAVKRRVEKEIQESLGDRVKDVDVRVSGRTILVRARASRFWHRWNARRTLNALAMPAGYRGKIELLD